MKKKIACILTLIITTGGIVTVNAANLQIIKNSLINLLNNTQKLSDTILKYNSNINSNEENINKLQAEINGIALSASPNGILKRTMNNETTTINYNEQYSCNYKFIKLLNWNGNFVSLVLDNVSGEKKAITSGLGTVWQDIEYDYFAESDIDYVYGTKYKLNDVAVYGDQLYMACDDGIVLVITPCVKCYKLKKLSDKDITSLSFKDNVIKFNENTENYFEMPISSVRQNNISVEEALDMRLNGALFIDVRDKSEFNEYHYEDSINIPLANIGEIDKYDRNTTLIFYCKSGGRATKALTEAQKMGFINVYNLGSVDNLL